MNECSHERWRRIDAADANNMCPICMEGEIERLKKRVAELERDFSQEAASHNELLLACEKDVQDQMARAKRAEQLAAQYHAERAALALDVERLESMLQDMQEERL